MSETTTFADALIVLGQHMKLCPGLPTPAHVSWRYYDSARPGFVNGLDVQLYGSSVVEWAATLAVVSSRAERLRSGTVNVYVRGVMGDDVLVEVWTDVDGSPFPDKPGVHEWDVTALLQEA